MKNQSEKEEHLARSQLAKMLNKVKMHWGMGKIKSFGDLLHLTGYDTTHYYPSELNHVLDFADVKSWMQDKQIEVDTYFWLKKNPPITELTNEEQEIRDFCVHIQGLHPTLSEAIKLPKEPRVSFEIQQELAAAEYAKRLPNLSQ